MTVRGRVDVEALFAASLPSSDAAAAVPGEDEPTALAPAGGAQDAATSETPEWKTALALAKEKLAASTAPPALPSDGAEPVLRHAYGASGDWRSALKAAKAKLGEGVTADTSPTDSRADGTTPASGDDSKHATDSDADGTTPASADDSKQAPDVPPPSSSPPPSSAPRSGPASTAPVGSEDEWRAAIDIARRVQNAPPSGPPPRRETAEAQLTPAASTLAASAAPAEPAEAQPPGAAAAVSVEPAAVSMSETPAAVSSSAALSEEPPAEPVEPPTNVGASEPAASKPADPVPMLETPGAVASSAVVAETPSADSVESPPNEAAPEPPAPQPAPEPAEPKPRARAVTLVGMAGLSLQGSAPPEAVDNTGIEAREPEPEGASPRLSSLESQEVGGSGLVQESDGTSEDDDWLAALEAAKQKHEDQSAAAPSPTPAAPATVVGSLEPAHDAASSDTETTAKDEWLAAIEAAQQKHEDEAPAAPAAAPAPAAPATVVGSPEPVQEDAAGTDNESTQEDEWLAAIEAAKHKHEDEAPAVPAAALAPAAPATVVGSPEPVQEAPSSDTETTAKDEWLAAIEAAKRLHEDEPVVESIPPPAPEPAAAAQGAAAEEPPNVAPWAQTLTHLERTPEVSGEPVQTATSEDVAKPRDSAPQIAWSESQADSEPEPPTVQVPRLPTAPSAEQKEQWRAELEVATATPRAAMPGPSSQARIVEAEGPAPSSQDDRPTPTVAAAAFSASLESPAGGSAPRAQGVGGSSAQSGAPRAQDPTPEVMPAASLQPPARMSAEPEAMGALGRKRPRRVVLGAAVAVAVFALGALVGRSSKPSYDSPPPAPVRRVSAVPRVPEGRAAAKVATENESGDLDPAALERLNRLSPDERTAAQVAALGRHWLRDWQKEFTRFCDELRKNPALLQDAATRKKVYEYVNDRSTSVKTLELLAALNTPRALDIVYETWTGAKERTDTTRLAEALLLASDVRSRLPEALALAMALRDKPTRCETVRQLTQDAIAHGDRRSSMLLVKMSGRHDCTDGQEEKDCGKCLEDPKELRAAIRASAGREAPPL